MVIRRVQHSSQPRRQFMRHGMLIVGRHLKDGYCNSRLDATRFSREIEVEERVLKNVIKELRGVLGSFETQYKGPVVLLSCSRYVIKMGTFTARQNYTRYDNR